MFGFELLIWCCVQENFKIILFIMVISCGDKENVVQVIQVGVLDYIGKLFFND